MQIEYLYPEICNLYGDSFNMRYLKKMLPKAGYVETHLKDTPYFVEHDVDLLYLGATTEDGQEWIVEKLRPYKQRLIDMIESGKVILCTGNSFEVFGRKIENEDGSSIDCLDIFPTIAKREMLNRYNSIFLGSMNDFEVVGFKSQFSHTYADGEVEQVMLAEKGCGLNPDSQSEGIRKNNFIGTYVIGPLLLLNPPFTNYLLNLLGEERRLIFENEAYRAYEVRLKEYHRPDIKLES